jgi:O-antigen ligase
LIGVGPGDTQDELQKCYQLDEDKNWALLYRPDFQYNAHSQYLQTFIDLGIVGLLLFLATLVVAAFIAIKHYDYLFLSFVVLFSFACLTESMLELNKGIVFFSFFISLFLNRYNSLSILR